jgi:hypothetical protein
MWILLGIALLAAWIALKAVWNAAGFGVHVLLAAAVAAVVVHFVRAGVGRRGPPAP